MEWRIQDDSESLRNTSFGYHMQILEVFKVLFVRDLLPAAPIYAECLGGVHPQKSYVPVLKDDQVLV